MKFFAVILLLSSYLFSLEFADIRQIPVGAKMTGKTRMARNVMTDFTLEVLSVMQGAAPGEDSLMAEIKDALFAETGVLAGMSGSPVMYEGKLVGAVAYTTSFLKKPIVGITPIAAMLRTEAWDLSAKSNHYEDGARFWGMKKIVVPLSVGGGFSLDEGTLAKLLGRSPDEFMLVPSSSGPAADAPQTFEPGDACAVSFVTGDLNLSGYGTVTYVSNDLILAFGHPMDLAGRVNMPLSTAFIDAVVPRSSISYKLGRCGKEAGAVLEDRSAAIMGRLGRKASMTPVDIILKLPGTEKKLHYEVISDPVYFSQYAPMVLANSFLQYASLGGESTTTWRLKIKTGYKDRVLEMADSFTLTQTSEAISSLAQGFASILKTFEFNSWLDIKVKAVELEVNLSENIDFCMIDDVRWQRRSYSPGEQLDFSIKLRRYKGGEFWTNLSVKIPQNIKNGTWPVAISSGYSFLAFDSSASPQKYMPQSPEKLFELLGSPITGKTMSAWVLNVTSGLIINGEEYPSLPTAARSLLESAPDSGKSDLYHFERKDFEMPWLIGGAQIFPVTIDDKKRNSGSTR